MRDGGKKSYGHCLGDNVPSEKFWHFEKESALELGSRKMETDKLSKLFNQPMCSESPRSGNRPLWPFVVSFAGNKCVKYCRRALLPKEYRLTAEELWTVTSHMYYMHEGGLWTGNIWVHRLRITIPQQSVSPSTVVTTNR
ncbi:hypothetical protein GN956_G12370 [Arapaima gigas]